MRPPPFPRSARSLTLLLACTAFACVQRPSRPAAPEPAPPDEAITLERIFGSPSLTGTPPSAPRWAPDSRAFAFSWNEPGEDGRLLWVSTPQQPTPKRMSTAPIRDFAWSADGAVLFTIRDAELWSTAYPGGNETRIATLGEGASTLSVSPTGDRLAYLRDGDLWLLDLTEPLPKRATELGIAPLSKNGLGRYNRPEREIGPGIWGGPTYAWSADGRSLAVHAVDRRSMRKVPFPDYLAPETDPNEIRRGYPGDANESRRVGLLNVADLSLRWLQTQSPEHTQVVGFSWSPNNVLLLDLASDTAVDRWLYRVDRASGALEQLWHGERASRIYTAFASAWHPNGTSVVFLSDLGDRYGLYQLDGPSSEPVLLTHSAADVLGGPTVVPEANAIFYAANVPNIRERQVLWLQVGEKAARQLTFLPGQNRAFPSPDGEHLAFMQDDEVSPPELYLVSTAGGEPTRITTSPTPEFQEAEWVRGLYVRIPSRIDDYELRARILEPKNLDHTRKYPVLFGPVYSNTARNRWSGRYSLVQQLLVARGYIVVQVDVRGSTGYGRAFREEFLTDFAGRDLDDLESAVAYMESLPHVDPDRIGIWGSSYGGTLTVYSLLKKPGLFQAGVAAAAAVDPHFFGTDDVAIVRDPQTHPEIFERLALRHTENLQDHLLIIHGMQDQVVPFKTTVVLADALIRAGKDFDFAFAPGATHSWAREGPYARFLFQKLVDHFDRYLR